MEGKAGAKCVGSDSEDEKFEFAPLWSRAEEAIPVSDIKAEGLPVAEVCPEYDFPEARDAYKNDALLNAVEVSLNELQVRADPEGVRRRALALRDAVITNRQMYLRNDLSSGLMEDIDAIRHRDVERGWTILHHASSIGRVEHVRELLLYAEANLPNEQYDLDGVGAYCAMVDNQGYQPIDLAFIAQNRGCVDLLRPYSRDNVKREGRVLGVDTVPIYGDYRQRVTGQADRKGD